MTAARTALLAAGLLMMPPAWAQRGPDVEPLLEESFEEPGQDGLPEGWSVFGGRPEFIEVRDTHAREGQRALWLSDPSEEIGVGLRSPQVPAEPGESYFVTGWWLAERGRSASLYIEFWNGDGERIEDGVGSFACRGRGLWSRCIGHMIAPEGAVAVTALPYSWSGGVTEGYFDDIAIGRGIPMLYDRTPKPPAEVDHPVGLYREADIQRAKRNTGRHEWARNQLQGIVNAAEWWMELPEDEIAAWIPEGTPFRVCDCPHCGATWGVDPWSFLADGRTECKRCGTIYPNDDYPETGTEQHVNPVGEWETISFYEDGDGKKYRLAGLRRYGRISKLSSLGSLGRAYALTGDVAYAERIREVLLRLAEVYPGYLAHDWHNIYRDYHNLQSGKLSGWKLHDANTLIELCLAYDLTVQSGVYSDEDRSIIEEGVFREGGRLLTTTSPRGCCVNDGPFLMAAGGYIGKLLGEHDHVAWAVEPPDGFFGFIEENFWRDGHWEDGSPSYEGMALGKFYVLPEILHGYSDPPSYQDGDRYERLDLLGHPLMRKVLIAGEHVTAPDGSSPPINDSVHGATHSARHAEENYFWFPTERNLRILKHAYGGDPEGHGTEYALFRRDPELDFEGVEPLDLATESLVRPGLGWAILRAGGEGPDEAMVVLDYGPIRGHAHPDKLNYLFYAHETELVTDLGYLGARHRLMPWLRACAAHNEVLVDGDAQRKVAGELLSFAPGELVQSLRAEAPEAFEQADLYERTLTMLAFPGDAPYVVDVFRVRGGQRSLMAFHGDGETFASTARYVPYDGRFITEAAEGGDWIRTCERAEAPGAFSATWRSEPENELGVRLTVLDAPAAAYHITAPGLRNRRTPWADRTLHVLLWEQAGSEPVFVSVAEAVRGEPRLGSIERVACSPAGAVGVRVQREGAMDYTFVADGDAATSEVRAELPEGLSFRGREAVVSVGETGPAYARLVDGTELRLGDLSLSCPGPMSGEIAAFDDEADTITTATELPGGEALRGQQLLVGGHVDGAYEIVRVERTETASVVHLARQPIMQVEAGDTFAISSIVEARRLDDGTWEVRADCPLQAELPRPADVNSRVMLRTPEGWQRLAHENADGVVRVRIDPEALEGGPAVLLITDGGIDLSDVRPPAVGAVRVDGEVLARGADVDLGYVQEPRVVAVELQDAANAISTAAFDARISGDPAAKIEAGLYRRDADGRSARAIVRLRELPPAQYTVRLHFCDRAANSGEAVVRFNTRGHVLRATELPVVADSGRLSKPLGGLDTQFYRSQEPGDWVEYAFETPQSATYEVTLVATGYKSYGTYQVSIDGRDLGEPVDAFRRDLDVAGITESLGTLRLGAGPHRLRLTTVGNNEQSQDYYIGWHSLVLRPVSDD